MVLFWAYWLRRYLVRCVPNIDRFILGNPRGSSTHCFPTLVIDSICIMWPLCSFVWLSFVFLSFIFLLLSSFLVFFHCYFFVSSPFCCIWRHFTRDKWQQVSVDIQRLLHQSVKLYLLLDGFLSFCDCFVLVLLSVLLLEFPILFPAHWSRRVKM